MRKNIFAGLSLGLLVGLLVGLSVSSVVGATIGALTGLLATFFGLVATKDGTPAADANLVRITAFSFACVLGVVGGIAFRTHGWLSPSIGTQVWQWRRVGYTDAESRQIVHDLTVAADTKSKAHAEGAAAPTPTPITVTGLFASTSNFCTVLQPDKSPTPAALVAQARAFSPDLATILDSAGSTTIDQQAGLVRGIYQVKCP